MINFITIIDQSSQFWWCPHPRIHPQANQLPGHFDWQCGDRCLTLRWRACLGWRGGGGSRGPLGILTDPNITMTSAQAFPVVWFLAATAKIYSQMFALHEQIGLRWDLHRLIFGYSWLSLRTLRSAHGKPIGLLDFTGYSRARFKT